LSNVGEREESIERRQEREIADKKIRRFLILLFAGIEKVVCFSLGKNKLKHGGDNQKLQIAIFRVLERATSCRRTIEHDLCWFRLQRMWPDLFDMQSWNPCKAQSYPDETVSERSCWKDEKSISTQ